ncbi:MAG: hypothetical protein LBP75_01565 [Planctomycetota bacterium]|jgi:hypothetical protein|nr:hypothetical protein [Planctomycetota bacterium]
MKYQLELEVDEDRAAFAEEFFNAISFVKKVKTVAPNEITNPAILRSIADVESGRVAPTPLNLAELRGLLHA